MVIFPTTFTDNSLASGTTYYYFVFSINSQNCTGAPVYNTSSPLVNFTNTVALLNCITPSAQPTNLNLTAKQNDEMFPYWVIDCSEKKNGKGSFRYSIKVHDMFLSNDEINILNSLSKNDYLNFSANNIASSKANVSKYNFYLALGFSNMPYEAAFCIPKSDDEYENELFDCTEEPQFNDKKQITIW